MENKTSYHHGDLKNALIRAGVEILSSEGVGGLSLRKVALKAGVSHAAPYAHFADKQALIAAISTEGFRLLYERLSGVSARFASDPPAQMLEVAWEYLQFALESPAWFKVMFSGVIERTRDYPEFVVMSQKNFRLVIEIVEANQAAGSLMAGSSQVVAIGAWSLVHGYVSLLLEGQIPHAISEQMSTREALEFALSQLRQKDRE